MLEIKESVAIKKIKLLKSQVNFFKQVYYVNFRIFHFFVELKNPDTTTTNVPTTMIPITTTTHKINYYQIPEVFIEVFMPKGLKVSVSHVEGIQLFEFHGKINREMHGREEGTFSGSVAESADGQWTYSDKSARLRIGDSIHYWIKVDYFDGSKTVTHYKERQIFIVTGKILINFPYYPVY